MAKQHLSLVPKTNAPKITSGFRGLVRGGDVPHGRLRGLVSVALSRRPSTPSQPALVSVTAGVWQPFLHGGEAAPGARPCRGRRPSPANPPATTAPTPPPSRGVKPRVRLQPATVAADRRTLLLLRPSSPHRRTSTGASRRCAGRWGFKKGCQFFFILRVCNPFLAIRNPFLRIRNSIPYDGLRIPYNGLRIFYNGLRVLTIL